MMMKKKNKQKNIGIIIITFFFLKRLLFMATTHFYLFGAAFASSASSSSSSKYLQFGGGRCSSRLWQQQQRNNDIHCCSAWISGSNRWFNSRITIGAPLKSQERQVFVAHVPTVTGGGLSPRRISPISSLPPIRPSVLTTSYYSSSLQAASSSSITADDDTSSSSSSSSKTETNNSIYMSMKDIASSLALNPSLIRHKLFGGKIPYWDTNANDNDTTTPLSFRVVFVLGGPGAGKGTQSELLLQHYSDSMIHHLSVGQLLRNEQDNEHGVFGATIRQALVAGQIVPVQISLSLVRQAMQRHVNNLNNSDNDSNNNNNNTNSHNKRNMMQTIFLVDGFPRNNDNLSGWCRFMTPYFNNDNDDNVNINTNNDTTPPYSSLWGVVVYHCPLQVLENRILERSKDSGRSDDNLKSIQQRFHTFQQETIPIIDKLRQASTSASTCTTNDDNSNNINNNWKVVDIRGDLPLNDVWLATKSVFDEFIQNDVLSANAALLQAIQQGNEQAYQQLVALQQVVQNDEENSSSSSKLCLDDEMATMTAAASDDNGNDILNQISNPAIEFVSGQNVTVQYNRPVRMMNDNTNDARSTAIVKMMRETRVWVHQGPVLGWRNVDCSRTPV